jgi:hypothetical protein
MPLPRWRPVLCDPDRRFLEIASVQSFETCDLLIRDSPIACTRSTTHRVDTPSEHHFPATRRQLPDLHW